MRQGKIDLSRGRNAGGDTRAGDHGDPVVLPSFVDSVDWPVAVVPAGPSADILHCSRSVLDSRKGKRKTSPRSPQRGKTTVEIQVQPPLPPRREWTRAGRCATLNSVVVVLFTLRGPLETETPIVAAIGVFHSSPHRL